MKHFGRLHLLYSAALAGTLSMQAFAQNPVVESIPSGSMDMTRQTAIANQRALYPERGQRGGVGTGGKPIWDHQFPSKWEKVLAASAEDQKANASFLHQHGTGIFRLLAANDNRSVNVADLRKPFVPIKGNGAYYSFTKRRNDFDEWADIALRKGVLVTGIADYSLGGIAHLGNIPLDTLNLETPGVEYLAKMSPPVTFEDAKRQFNLLSQGIGEDGFIYKSSVPNSVDSTYILRSVKYKRYDALIAFRIVRQDADGNLTILWKELKTFRVPALR